MSFTIYVSFFLHFSTLRRRTLDDNAIIAIWYFFRKLVETGIIDASAMHVSHVTGVTIISPPKNNATSGFCSKTKQAASNTYE